MRRRLSTDIDLVSENFPSSFRCEAPETILQFTSAHYAFVGRLCGPRAAEAPTSARG